MRYWKNSKFADFVTEVAFNLTLSRAMCSYLLAVEAENKFTQSGKQLKLGEGYTIGLSSFITTSRSLESRGLIERKPIREGNTIYHREFVTEEGKLVCDLIRAAGISAALKIKRRRK